MAQVLVKEFGVERVWLFGSLAKETGFRRHSDIDLAVEGLRPGDLYRAVGRVLQMSTFSVDLKPMDELPQAWQERIRRDGEPLA